MDYAKGVCTPNPADVFRPLALTKPQDIRVFMLFPETYYVGNATGIPVGYAGDKKPFMYQAFIDELERDIQVKASATDFDKWCKQGVLMWNSRPTTTINQPGGHLGKGWMDLTQELLETAYLVNPKTIFVLFGTEKVFRKYLPEDAIVFSLPLPVFGPRCEFKGSGIFSAINKELRKNRRRKVNWST